MQETTRQKAYDFMHEKNKDYPKEIAMEYFGSRISYGELFEKIESFAGSLKANGVEEGDRVTLVLPNVPEIVYLFYAVNRIGAVANFIDPRTNAEAILARTNESGSKLLFVISDLLKTKIDGIAEKVKAEKIIIITPADSLRKQKITTIDAVAIKAIYGFKKLARKKKSQEKYVDLKHFLKRYDKENESEQMNLDSEFREQAPCSIVYTSGTSGGAAKGAVISNEAYNAMHGMQMSGQIGYARQNTFLGVIPLFAAYGSLNGMHNSLCNGWTIQMIPKFHPNDFDLLIKKYKPNNALGVPRFWESIVDNGRLEKMDLSFLILPTCGGDKITPASVEKINRFFAGHGSRARLIVGYGATEFGGAFSVTVADEKLYEPGSVGIFMPGVKTRIFDPETGEEQTGEERIGELYVHSPSMMLGYFQRKEETDEITHYDEDGTKYYKTGDKVRIDKRGINWVVDRYKRVMMRPDGHTVGASPIENVISAHPSVLGCAVVGIPLDQKGGTIPTAFVKLKDTETDRNEILCELDELCSEKLPARDKALAYVIVDELPYTLMGKVDYRRLEERKFEDMELYWVKDPLTMRG